MTVADEIKAALEGDQGLMHYGMPRRSGRYPWGSGEEPYQHGRDFLSRVEELKKTGWKETPENIKKEFGLTTTQYRVEKSLCKDERRMLAVATAKSLHKDGLGATEIGKKMGVNESTVRSLLNANSESRMKAAMNTANFIKEQIDKKGFVEIGAGVERELGISKEKMKEVEAILNRDGYPVYRGRVDQVTNPGKKTTITVACPPGTEHKEIYDTSKINSLNEYVSHDGGETFDKYVYPKSLDSKRIHVRYAEDGGKEKDGLIEIRPGVKDISLGEDRYAQVRILVDDSRYLKGMAAYSDNMPDGVDVIFNTHYSKDVPKMETFKKIKDDPENPFGALIKAGGQSYYTDENGKRQLSVINKTRGEGDWDEWANALPSQFLAKQSLSMAKKQLGLAIADKEAEYDSIMAINNPTIKKHFLAKFADECDSTAIHLKAAALPGQKYHVILPVSSLSDKEVYAPGYENGTKLALIRYPHGGTFEIPILTVNNKNQASIKLIGKTPIDAICINSKVAERLSGADFDGDTVMCIPTHDSKGRVKVTSTPPLEGLEGFDHQTQYAERPGMKYMSKGAIQNQMGSVSNLIMDMTLQGAEPHELAAAVRHSMVVIDAYKHKLDYKQSEIDNNIAALKKRYQTGGASTLITRAKGQKEVPKRQGSPKVNMKGKDWYDPTKPEGSLVYALADDLTYEKKTVNKRTGEVTTTIKTRTQKSTRMGETDDAYTLVSKANTPIERAYADYANKMKSMANRARMEQMTTGKIAYSKEAKAKYQTEVDSLMDKLNTALLNAPKERQALLRANAEIAEKRLANPDMTKEEQKKISTRAVNKYRNEVGSVSRRDRSINITDNEWKAIQAGAISENKLKQILDNADADSLRSKATPKTYNSLSPAKINMVKAMASSNYSLNQIANKLGVSTSTISKYLKG